MSNALSVRGIVKQFGNHLAVDDVSFEVKPGVVYGILGPNGAGKTTTLRMINDIIKPDRGTIVINGLAPGLQAARKIGYLPEERGLYPKMRVLDAIEFLGELRGLSRRDAKARGTQWLDKLGLGQWKANKVQDLSKGMQQKVQFAAALIHDPELVILDEPWSGLDPINADVLRDVVREQKAAGRTVLFSTHQMEQAEKICEHICIIARGKKVLEGRLAELKRAAAALGRVGLGFATAGDRDRAAGVLADRALATVRAAEPGDDADDPLAVELDLAAGVDAQAVLAVLLATGAALHRFEVVTPSLHQIFVDRVGRHEAQVAARHAEDAA